MLYSLTRGKLLQIEKELQTKHLLSAEVPSTEAMASKMPFACDAMPFEHWLQFIFLPKMHELVDLKLPLPNAIALAPMAHQVWGSHTELDTLIGILIELDELLSESR